MRNVIVDGRVVEDDWRVLDAGAALPEAGAHLVPHAKDAAAHLDALRSRGPFGVWIDGADDPALLAPALPHAQLVAVRFPVFTDGRGYSTAALIRRMGWTGDLRAIGDVLRDQLLLMRRVGFTSFAVREDKDAQAALSAFADFSGQYQGDAVEPLPWFRRRRTPAGSPT